MPLRITIALLLMACTSRLGPGGSGGGAGGGSGGGFETCHCPPFSCTETQACPDPKDLCRFGVTVCDCPFSWCAAQGKNGEGSACATSDDCDLGLQCVANACRRLCGGCRVGSPCDLDAGVCSPSPFFSACLLSGGLDHLFVSRFDPANGQCVVIHVASPGDDDGGLALPDGWHFVNAEVGISDGGCGQPFTSPSNAREGTVVGDLSIDGGALTLQVVVTFDGGAVRVAAQNITDCR